MTSAGWAIPLQASSADLSSSLLKVAGLIQTSAFRAVEVISRVLVGMVRSGAMDRRPIRAIVIGPVRIVLQRVLPDTMKLILLGALHTAAR
jgi:hypothetical protein